MFTFFDSLDITSPNCEISKVYGVWLVKYPGQTNLISEKASRK